MQTDATDSELAGALGAGDAPVTVLTSAVGFGTYVPALLNQRALREVGVPAELEVIEGWFAAPSRARHLAHKAAFREDFRLAIVANRMPQNVQGCLDLARVDALLARWADERRSRFIVWSGFWFPVLERYLTRVAGRALALDLDLCRIDAVVSASFRIQRPLPAAQVRDIWLWNWAEKRLGWYIPVGAAAPIPYDARAPRLVVHGGGWALGNYTRVLPELAGTPFALDVLTPEQTNFGASQATWPGRGAADRLFSPRSDWHPWQRDADEAFVFPPLREMGPDGPRHCLPNQQLHPAHQLVREARAVVSKPGGGTLIDSLASATPVVLLEPYGDAEARSADLWEHLGFGIRYERWRATGFDPGVLARLHQNLLDAAPHRTLPRYPADAFPRVAPSDGGARARREAMRVSP
jgi:hypothetical protein